MSDDKKYLVGPASELKPHLDPEAGQPIKFDDQDVPTKFASLIPLARIWGIRDDILRDEKVFKASTAEIQALRQGVSPLYGSLVEWLGGEAAQILVQNDAYQALSCLSYAYELAKSE